MVKAQKALISASRKNRGMSHPDGYGGVISA